MSEGSEKIFFFLGSNRRKLLGVLYRPCSLHARQVGIVYCHPFAEEQNMSHSVAVKACRAFCKMGFTVFRFDMSGCGDSEGNFDEVSVATWLDDIRAAVGVLKQESGVHQVAMFGVRLGGGLALLHATTDKSVPFLILWEPVLDFSLHIKQFLRRAIVSKIMAKATEENTLASLEEQLSSQGTVSVMGYPITRMMYDSFCRVDQKPLYCRTHDASLLVLSISAMDRPSMQMAKYKDLLTSNKVKVHFEHIQSEPFWDRYWR